MMPSRRTTPGLNLRPVLHDAPPTSHEAGSTVAYQVSSDGGTSWSTTTGAQSNLADGTYQFRTVVTDAAGNTASSTAITVTVDTSAPAAGTLALTNFTDSGSSGAGEGGE